MRNYKGVVFILLFLASSCDKPDQYNALDMAFTGFWAETIWEYQFRNDGTFTFKTSGHYDNSTEKGIYIIKNDLIFLSPDSDWSALDGVLKTKLKIISKECIRDFDNNFYCLDTDSVNFHADMEYKFIEEVDSTVIDVLELDSLCEGQENCSLDYRGIIMVTGAELHLFVLEERGEKQTWTKSSFLVKKMPFEVFKHNIQGNKLTSIYRK